MPLLLLLLLLLIINYLQNFLLLLLLLLISISFQNKNSLRSFSHKNKDPPPTVHEGHRSFCIPGERP